MSRPHGTGIEWTHFPDGYRGVDEWHGVTWNPCVGCTPARGSEKGGCLNCYARVLHNNRHEANARVAMNAIVGSAVGVVVIKQARRRGVALPFPPQYDTPFANVQLLPDRLDWPLRKRDPHAIFVGSMTDLFHDDVPDDYLDRVFAAMALTPQHIYMVLSKRPERMRAYLDGLSLDRVAAWMGAAPDLVKTLPKGAMIEGGALRNVWLGTSVEDQKTADERVPLLLDTPAAMRFISAEPLLGPVDFMPWLPVHTAADGVMDGTVSGPRHRNLDGSYRDEPQPGGPLGWVIVGGESGKGHRPMDPDWARSIMLQCRAANVAFFMKQNSGARSASLDGIPEEMRIREWPV